MASLKDLVAFLVEKYPIPEELTRGRLEKLVYLIDVEWAWKYGEQLTEVEWFFNDYGPFNGECDSPIESLETEGKIKVHQGVNMLGNPKIWYEWIEGKERTSSFLSDEEMNMSRGIIGSMSRLKWGDFVKHVYSTPPMVDAENQYSSLDIVGSMKRRRKELIHKAREKVHEKYEDVFRKLART